MPALRLSIEFRLPTFGNKKLTLGNSRITALEIIHREGIAVISCY